MKRLALIPLFLTLAACAQVQTATNDAARVPAKRVAIETVFTLIPEIPKELTEAAANCAIYTATVDEVNALAGDAIAGVDTGTAQTIRSILVRPAGADCLSAAAASLGMTI